MRNLDLLIEMVTEYLEKTYGHYPDVSYGEPDDGLLLDDEIEITIELTLSDPADISVFGPAVYEYNCYINEDDLEYDFMNTVMNVLKRVSDKITDGRVRRFLTNAYNEGLTD